MTPTDRATTPNESAQLEQLSERMQGLAIQTSVYDKVDVTLWEQDIKPDEEDEIAVTTYAARFMSNAQFERLEGDNILDHFQQHFEGWNQDTWNRVHMDYKRALRLLLRRRGIYTGRENAHPTTHRFRHPELVQSAHNPPPPDPPSEPMHPEAYTKLPPDDTPNAPVDADTQYMFMKLWDKDQNYTGEPYDLLDDKLRIFMSICYNIQVKPSQFHALFPRILAGRAQTFYIDKIEWTTTFRKAYDSIKQRFDTEVNHVHYYTDWTTTTFNSIRAQDASKSLHEVLQLLFDKLQLCQRALGPDYAGNIPLRTTLIIACRGVPELEYALFKPAEKIETLFADLRSSVETHLARRTNLQFTQSPDGSFDQTDPNDQYYLDRRYHNNRVRGYNRGSHRPQSRGNYAPSYTNRNGPKNFGTYILDYEGHEMDDLNDDNDIWEENDNDTNNHPKQWQASQMLCQQAFNHLITGEDVRRTDQNTVPAYQFFIEDRYSKDKF
ncbi:hypothetical protein HRG_009739 [Hirsutella rhossiliensis]|uniref:Uncharacterized protein n=1 Tax=Hirsutella rhossiliensis TaxID=111463 RepID=A0A9P8MN57_9HYPO|nr:uncharacterized protein HRG_09739 [Hirsutella rhossiliensis]KAH0959278.1 hypothetical protein HRG_09739 [Hirsutella rhossiliensis]